MVEVIIKDEQKKMVAIESGDYCMSIIGNHKEDHARAIFYGSYNMLEFAEAAGACLRDVLKRMAKNYNDPLTGELLAMSHFAENFYDNGRKAPIDNRPSAGRNDNNTTT